MAGRVFTSDEDRPGHAQVVVISERLWRSHFHGDSAFVGQTIQLNGLPYTVIGVMPKSFDPMLDNSDLWVPAAYTAQQLAEQDYNY